MATKLIPLNKLVISANNVRKAKTSKAEDDELYASLRHHGLKQNLLVHAVGDEFHVHAGGRRLTQLQRLAKDGHLKAAEKIPCRVEAEAVARETSLVENGVRVSMSPADQLEAFARLIAQGSTVEEVATRFGVTTDLVERRLKLARLAPEIIEDLREGTITLETAKAFTLSNDHARQLEVREPVSHLHAGGVHHTVRRLLTDHAQSGNTRLARYVGVDKYKAAGGPVIEDLFSDEGSVLLEDGALLEKLAVEKLERAAKKQGKGWKWSDAVQGFDYSAGLEFGRVYPEPQDLDPEVAEERETLRTRLDELEDLDNDDWTEALEQEADRATERLDEIDEIEREGAVYSDAQRAIAGCIVTVDYQGKVTVEAGLVRPQDIPADEPPASTDGEDGDATGGVEETSGKSGREESVSSVVVAPPRSVKTPPAPVDPVTAARKEKGISRSLADDLRAMRHQILQAHLCADYDAAFDTMVYVMCRKAFARGYEALPLDVTLKPAMVEGSRDVLQESMAVDVARFWRPTVETYWGRVKKDHALDVARDLIGDDWANDRSHYKKALLAKSMEACFADDAGERVGMSPQGATRTAAWLPEGMGFADEAGADLADTDTSTDPNVGTDPSAGTDPSVGEDEQGADPETAQSQTEDDENPDEGGLPDFLRGQSVDPVEALLSGKPGGSPAVYDAVPTTATKSPMGDAAE